MRAVLIKDGVGPAENLYIGDRPVPALSETPPSNAGGAEVLVRVKAFGLNRMDILQREGKYPLPPGTTDILGVEFSGTVAEVGPAPSTEQETVYHPKIGDEVFGLALGGAYAEYIKVQSALLLPKPKALSWEQAAAIPENWFTAYQALRLIADLRPPSEWSEEAKISRRQNLGLDPSQSNSAVDELQAIGKDVLIHAGASGVGLAAIQLARDLGARKVFATAGTDEKVNTCVKLAGADAAFNYKTTDWADALAEHNGLIGSAAKAGSVDVIVDFIAGDYWNKNVASARRDGRIVMLGVMGGAVVKDADVASLIFKRLRVEGSALRSRSLAYQSALVQNFLRQGNLDKIVAGLDADKKAGTTSHEIVIHKVYPWEQIQDAHRLMEANANTGKIIATIY